MSYRDQNSYAMLSVLKQHFTSIYDDNLMLLFDIRTLLVVIYTSSTDFTTGTKSGIKINLKINNGSE